MLKAEGLTVKDKLPQEWEMVCLRFKIGDNYNNLK